MARERNGGVEARPLEILGISEAEEQAYRWLLQNYGATVQNLVQALGFSASRAQQLLASLQAKGLATHSPERPRRYIPVSPDIALKALSLQRQEELQHADAVIQQLQEDSSTRRQVEREQIVELLTNREVERRILEQIHRSAQNEVITLIRLPLRVSRPSVPVEQNQTPQREAQSRGVHYRSIIDSECLASPGVLQATRDDMKAGEEVRVISKLPFKMVLADRSLALIPLNVQKPGGPSLLVRSSALLDALHTLFQVLWEQAGPIAFTRQGALECEDDNSWLTQATEELISLLATGLNDKNIAHDLGVTPRTLQRHVTALMHAVDARTRFQLGWLCAFRLSSPGSASDAANKGKGMRAGQPGERGDGDV